jgi:hypothetical protein
LSLRDEITQELAGWHIKGALFWVELDAVSIKVGESFAQVIEQAACFQGLDDDIVDVYFDVAFNAPPALLPVDGARK